MMKRSFSENTEQKETPAQQRQVRDHEKTLKEMTAVECVHCSDLEDYYKDTAHLLTLNYDLMKFIFSTSAGSKVLSPGRLFVICHMAHRNSVAVLLRSESPPKVPAVTLTVLVLCSENMVQRNAGEGALLPLPVHELSVPQGKLSHEIVNIAPTDVLYITNQRLALKDPAAMLKPKPPLPGGKKRPEEGEADELTQQLMVIAEKMNQKDEVTTIDPKKDLKILDLDFAEKWSQYKTIKDRLRTYECLGCPDLNAHYGDTYVRKSLHDKVQKLKYNLSQQNLSLLPEYEQRIRVLQRLMYVDHDRIVQLKGRVACEINNCDEVLVTELIFNNVLTDLTAEQIVALLSCMVFQSKINDEPCLTKALQEGQENIIKMATLIGETQMECGMTEPVDTYLETLKFGLVEVVYEWARGMPFAEITNLTTVEEGVIVRCIVRLDETCRDVRNAARVIGDPLLYKKMELASELIKRDIVFAASLYTA
ncbi:hypothetical protein SARC_08590 [Sphaeroforma arctica JP610]|uniref:ATP-dependent RNA helicase Ski2/MTR4 C-terminal domain-containing protein n=1 Tax=Sphaeroforma arctica JP610 TaxID=667725 RepID=A0A0L0FR30_9EUKA|nr:hypothetical protein, variant [Sphaeroforma arctica JP610]XP_014152904.1 hypothetical protein SARC_08590 [Sphaeroforma arctica JP610]KNC79001.1 hypothetical protein, variant [Sphaeroforma arctica JP610]KNC79002.1 hypothetical protein SARC_08590 [Sphaeroforma arctica JP610]|eukprot:XP_014152903.1 hypothetical protein, variant [Sphaeroforma arctica JP610]